MKKTIALIFFALTFALAQTTTVNSLTAALPASVFPGPTYTGTLTLTCPGSNCAGVEWSMTLSNGITIPGPVAAIFTAIPGSAATAAGKVVSCADFPGILNCVVVGSGAGATTSMSSGPVASFQFTVLPGTPPGPVTLNFSNVVATDATGIGVTINPPPSITVNVVAAPCDLNGDGKLDSADFGLLISRVLGVTVPATTGACDINGDKACNVQDLILLGHSIVIGSCVVQ